MLEVWDVVDRARKRDVSIADPGAQGDAEAGQHTFPLDATMVDVYQNRHAAVFLIDPSKKWTYEYVQRNCRRAEHVPTCILINFRAPGADKRYDSVGGGGGGLRGGVQRSPVPTVRRRDVASELLRPKRAVHVPAHPVLVSEARQPGARAR